VVGFSLIENPAGATITETPSGSNLTGVDPQLGPLADNGGPTRTLLPALTSPAVDAGIASSLTADQRGLPRTADLSAVANRTGSDATDIGAVEVQGASCQGAVVFADFRATEGDDTLTGSGAAESISALGGNDAVSAGGGNDCVSGGDGNDKASGQGGKDQIKGDAGKDNLSGGGGKDKVIGGDGKDTVKGGGGADKLKGNAGKDKIKSRGGGKDKVNCGAGKDKAIVDSKDKVSKNCETVS
jgi:Ca2+-binding RTX toxin-like protein